MKLNCFVCARPFEMKDDLFEAIAARIIPAEEGGEEQGGFLCPNCGDEEGVRLAKEKLERHR